MRHHVHRVQCAAEPRAERRCVCKPFAPTPPPLLVVLAFPTFMPRTWFVERNLYCEPPCSLRSELRVVKELGMCPLTHYISLSLSLSRLSPARAAAAACTPRCLSARGRAPSRKGAACVGIFSSCWPSCAYLVRGEKPVVFCATKLNTALGASSREGTRYAPSPPPLSLSLSRSDPPSSPLRAQQTPRVPRTISTMRTPAKSHVQSARALCICPVCRDSHAHALTTPDLAFATTLVPRVAVWQWQWQQHETRETRAGFVIATCIFMGFPCLSLFRGYGLWCAYCIASCVSCDGQI